MMTHGTVLSSGWAIWRPVLLRAAGFPASGVARLSAPLLARAADALGADPLAADRAGSDWQAYRDVFAAETRRLSGVIRDIALEPRFQSALSWQNHLAIDTAVAPILRNGGELARRNSKHRAHEELIANYWQRYCLKNDSIGFFGPVGWVAFDESVPATQLRPGPALLASFEVFFESWAMDRLAEAIAAEPGMAAWVAPRRTPFAWLDGDRVCAPAAPSTVLSAADAAVLRRVDGITPAGAIAQELAGGGLAAEEEVFEILRQLCRRRLIIWKLELPLSPRPERHIRQFLSSVGDRVLAAGGLASLQRLESAREAVRAASTGTDPMDLVGALRALDDVFIDVTGAAPSRNSGRAYGGRTLVYHDARRDVELTLGADFAAVMAPVDLLLHSARWLTYQFGQEMREKFRGIADRLAAEQGWPVNLASFWFECLPVFRKFAPETASRLQAEFQQHWASILRCPLDQARVQLCAGDVRDQVLQAFEAPRSGWAGARYCSPDIMIAARDLAAIGRGDFHLVLGEFHLALASSRHYCFVTQHPSPAELLDCVTADNQGPRLIPVQPKEDSRRLTVRTQSALTRDEDFLVAFFEQPVDARRPRVFRAAELTVAPAGDDLRIAVPGGPSFDFMDVFAEMLMNVIMDRFAIFPASGHLPRVSLDRLVISRETWRFPARELTFPDQRDEAERFAAARAWWRRELLPGRVFVKVPGELKPFFVDFASPAYINLFTKALRRLPDDAYVQISEMLPAAEELWLTDGDGHRYTAELRLVAVDCRGPFAGAGADTEAGAGTIR